MIDMKPVRVETDSDVNPEEGGRIIFSTMVTIQCG